MTSVSPVTAALVAAVIADPDALVEAVARRVVELLRDERNNGAPAAEWVDAARVAAELGTSRDWVYTHADELGAVRLGACGDGHRPRLRFDLSAAVAAIARGVGDQPHSDEPRANSATPVRRRPRSLGTGVDLLPIRGRSEAA